jgi:hypothetical protein
MDSLILHHCDDLNLRLVVTLFNSVVSSYVFAVAALQATTKQYFKIDSIKYTSLSLNWLLSPRQPVPRAWTRRIGTELWLDGLGLDASRDQTRKWQTSSSLV